MVGELEPNVNLTVPAQPPPRCVGSPLPLITDTNYALQYYSDTTIILLEADPNFPSTRGIGSGVVASDMVTSDGGKTWTIASIMIPAMV